MSNNINIKIFICAAGWISAFISFITLFYNKNKEKKELKEKLLEYVEKFINLSKNKEVKESDYLIMREKFLNILEIHNIDKGKKLEISDELYTLEFFIKNNKDYITSFKNLNKLIQEINK
jgi:hypothetical protein